MIAPHPGRLPQLHLSRQRASLPGSSTTTINSITSISPQATVCLPNLRPHFLRLRLPAKQRQTLLQLLCCQLLSRLKAPRPPRPSAPFPAASPSQRGQELRTLPTPVRSRLTCSSLPVKVAASLPPSLALRRRAHRHVGPALRLLQPKQGFLIRSAPPRP